jgi:hypothetical protein
MKKRRIIIYILRHLNALQDIENLKKATYIFANKKYIHEPYMIKLQETHSDNNPIAKIPIETITEKSIKIKLDPSEQRHT